MTARPPVYLLLESTCDETAAAVVDEELHVLASVVASQDELHRRFGGVVPEIASRAHVERILPTIDEALRRAGLSLAEIDCVAVATTPGLAGSLLVGLCAAKAIALVRGIPLVAIHHLEAHLYACRLAAKREVFPCVGLVVSGGHSTLYEARSPIDIRPLGGTIDDAAGEAFDKVAAMLHLPYPGGPVVSQVAERGDPRRFAFPRSFLREDQRLQFSFSGLKTAVRYQLAPPGQELPPQPLDPQFVADLAASFEQAVVDVLVDKAFAALRATGLRTLCVGGGVAANRVLRRDLAAAAERAGCELHIAPPAWCTDNAVMGAIAIERRRAGLVEGLDLDIVPGPLRVE